MLTSFVCLTLTTALMDIQQENPLVATSPVERLSEDWWKQRHSEKVTLTKSGKADLVFLGDSITHGWETTGKATWDKYYGHRNSANFGYSGDRTEHVLWRLANDELIAMQPKVVVIMIGTNNLGHGSSNPSQTAIGVQTIVSTLQNKIPGVKILLLSIFPRGLTADDKLRLGVEEATKGYQSLAQPGKVVCLDIGKYFLSISKNMRTGLMPDLLHPNEAGYEIWAMAIERELSSLLGDTPVSH